MGQLCKLALFGLVLMAVLHSSSGRKTGSKSNPSKKPSSKPSQGTKTQSNYPRQPSNPGYPNQNPGAGSYPAGGSYPSAGGYPNPGRGGGYPNQNPAGGGYSNQYPGRSGYSPGGYPGGSYPVRTAGQPGGYPGGHPSIGGGYPNWNPKNKILSPRYGGSFGGGGFGTGGSPFSNTVKSMGYGPSPQSKGFAKKAMLAAGTGAVAGMAVGYGIGKFPRSNYQFRGPHEERQYNHYMHARQDTPSKNRNNKGGQYAQYANNNYTSPKQPSQAQSYEQYMSTCMKQKDLLKEQDMTDSADRRNIQRDEPLTDVAAVNDTTFSMTVNDYPKAVVVREDDDDTVSIMQIGYPALTEQMKARKCVELYLVYSEWFAEKQKEDKKETKGRKVSNNHNGHRVSRVLLLLTTFCMLLSGT